MKKKIKYKVYSMKNYLFNIALLIIMLVSYKSYAVVRIDLTQGNTEPLPVAINNFFDKNGQGNQLGVQIREVIENDLRNSGLFRPIDQAAFLETPSLEKKPNFVNWRQVGALVVSAGRISNHSNKLTIEFSLWDPSKEILLDEVSFNASESSWRRVGHKIADFIYKRLTGETGYFDSRVVFISEAGDMRKRIKKLAIMDQDGANYKELTDGSNLVLTPRFDPKSQRVIYLSYKNKLPQVFLLDLHTGNQRLIGNFPGMSFAPRFSADGQKAVMSIAKSGTTDIYEVSLSSGKLARLSNTPHAINTSPSYSPDGSKIVFNSDRGSKPQLYIMNSDGSNATRISSGEGSYMSPVWSPRGDLIAFTKQKSGQFYIGVMNPDGSNERLLTSSWMDEGPTWSPNGRVIMFSRQKPGAGYNIYSVDVTGYNERLIETPIDASDPAWSPLLG